MTQENIHKWKGKYLHMEEPAKSPGQWVNHVGSSQCSLQ